ncbi:MAG: ferrous iron transport protein B [Acidobacteriota bacterium]|nr:ferrous iron transport protein B [Acidobacteriota bacterium]
MSLPSSESCAACPVHNLANLRKLGVNMENWDYVVALAGNPNTGKSTVFNALTGLRQHTGNWPGKTVTRAEGGFHAGDDDYKLVDLPGTYSLLATSFDEEIARDFILFGQPDVTVVVVDATRLERNLNLALQVLEITDRVVVCLNLMDEAKRSGLDVDCRRLARDLGVPVVPTSARYGEGLDELLQAIGEVASGSFIGKPKRVGGHSTALDLVVTELGDKIKEGFPMLPNTQWVALRLLDGDERISQAVLTGELIHLQEEFAKSSTDGQGPADQADNTVVGAEDKLFSAVNEMGAGILEVASELRWKVGPDFHQVLMEGIYTEAARLADRAVTGANDRRRFDLDRAIDRLVTSRTLGIPLMLALLTLVFWLTITGANVPSAMLATLLIDNLHVWLREGAMSVGIPWWISGLLIDGMYLGTAWVVSVMLPPMAIFFPMFTLLEDFGYLPRVAFNLDRTYGRVGAHGKQALTAVMGFGCNAAGVIATRIIDSPRERLIAIITNNFSLCNGRWPTQILIASIFVGALAPAYLSGLVSALAVVTVAVFGIFLSFGTSWLLSRTILRGEVSTFHLELPPYRPPRVLQTIYTSLIDRTIYVLWRAIVFALPAGAVIWLVSNVNIAGISVAEHVINWLNPLGLLFGLSGVILLAYLVAIPANEIVVPTILMLIVLVNPVAGFGEGAGIMFELDDVSSTATVLQAGGFTLLMAINLMLFSLVHNPCSTTIYTIYKETGSAKWTAVASLLPVAMGFGLCFVVAQVWRLVAGYG